MFKLPCKIKVPLPLPNCHFAPDISWLCSVWTFMIIECFASLTQYSFIVVTLFDKTSNGRRGGVTT